MSYKNTPAERQLVKFIESFPLPAEVIQGWVAVIQQQGMSEELAEQIHAKLAEPVDGQPLPNRARLLVELAAQIKRWRMSEGARKFGR